MKHTHQFIRISDIDKPEQNNPMRRIPGAIIGCALCGTMVKLFEDGDLRE